MPRSKSTGLPREAEEKLRVEALLEVAASVFLEAGFQGASMTEMARRARSSKQTFYARFASKEKLFLAVVQWQLLRTTGRFGSLLAEQAPLRQVLLNVAHHFHTVILGEENVALLRIICINAHRFPEIAGVFVHSGPEQGTAQLAQFFAARTEAGLLKAENAQLAAEYFLSLIEGQALGRALLGLPRPYSGKALDARIAHAVDLFLTVYAK